MSDNPVIAILKRLAGTRPDDAQAAAAVLKAIKVELASAHAELSAATAEFGARLVEAMAEGRASAVEADLDAKRLQVARLERARDAVTLRLEAAQEAAGAAELAKRWDAAEKAMRAHRLALVRFQRQAQDLAAAMLAAESAAIAAYQSIPVRDGIRPFLMDLTWELKLQLALATEGKHGGFVRSSLPELQAHPPLIARAEAHAAEWLSKRPPQDQATPPEAA